MKKLINRPEAAVDEMVGGLLFVYPHLRRLTGWTVLVRDDEPTDAGQHRVALISGGGSGHEPAHAGYVGAGMLSAAVAGDVFTSPTPASVLAAIRETAGTAGAVLIVKNYTGDRLNFGLAAEFARDEGIPVEVVMVADDVALANTAELAGRRGLAGTIFVHKVAGAAASAGLTLAEVAAEARATAGAVRTMGVALSPCLVPGAARPSFTIGDGEVELGLGIHGEPGVRRVPIEPADAMVDHLLGPIFADLDLASGERVALLVNNLGATPAMELAIVTRHAVDVLEARGLKVERVYAGTFLSALEMGGVSISILRLDDARLARLDAPTAAPAWSSHPGRPPERSANDAIRSASGPTAAKPAAPPMSAQGRCLDRVFRSVAEALIADEAELNELDRQVGDGDLGTTLSRGSHALLEALPTYPLDDPSETFRSLAVTLMYSLGGTSGPLYTAFFLEIAARLKNAWLEDPTCWVDAFRGGCQAITKLGGAKQGDRTMLDALEPAVSGAFRISHCGGSVMEIIDKAVYDAQIGVRMTKERAPRFGRSSYLSDRVKGIPDPGAQAVAVWLGAVAAAIRAKVD